MVGERRDAESHVAENLDVSAAESESHQRAEHRIGGDADDGFDAADDHRLDQHAVGFIGGCPFGKTRDDRAKGLAHFLGCRQVQAHGADDRSCARRGATPASPPPGSRAPRPASRPRRPSA